MAADGPPGAPPAWADATEGMPAISASRAMTSSRGTFLAVFGICHLPVMERRCSPVSAVHALRGSGTGRLFAGL